MIVKDLKKKALQLRKERSPVASAIVFAISEIENVGKNDGNRDTTEDEAIRVIQKLFTSIDQNIEYARMSNNTDQLVHLNFEKNILKSVLPDMITEDEIRAKLALTFDEADPKNKGEIMKWAKSTWGSTVDMKTVGVIARELYGV
mgnify:CR=1 FL=1